MLCTSASVAVRLLQIHIYYYKSHYRYAIKLEGCQVAFKAVYWTVCASFFYSALFL